MKTIILFRHGKSDWDSDFETDLERPLAKRGVKASKAMGEWLKETDQIPDYCMVSPAVRTRQTFEYASNAGQWNAPTTIREELYDTTVDTYLAVIASAPDHIQRLIIVGHEPTCSMTTSALVGGRSDIRFPTATMARIDLDIEQWSELHERPGQLIWLQPPRFLS